MIDLKFLLLLIPAGLSLVLYYFHKRAIWIVLLFFVLAGLYLNIQPVDDMFIALRYARNWGNGFGPVFNIGERVEGYTCFLWVALLAGFQALNVNILAVARILSVIFALLSIYGVHLCASKSESLNRTLAVSTLAINLPLLYWAFVGMEVSLMAFLNLCCLIFYLNWIRTGNRSHLRLFSILAVLSTLTRPEGIILFGISWIWILFFSQTRVRDAAESVLIYLIGIGSFVLWRYGYYGYALPNTFYAKVDRFGIPLLLKGIQYTLLFFIPHILLLAPLVLPRRNEVERREFFFLVSLFVCQCLAVMLEGGDHYPASRFFVPVLPVLALLWLNADLRKLRIVGLRLSPEFREAFFVGAICMLTLAAAYFLRGYRAFESAAGGEKGQFISRWLKDNVQDNTLIATMSVGAVPYLTGLPTLDLVGLVDPHISHVAVETGHGKIGHEKFDNDYVMRRKPGVFLFARCYQNESELLTHAKGILPVYRDLLTRYFPNPDYIFVRVGSGRFCSTLLVRKDLALNWKLDSTGSFLGVASTY
jgi:arabinofuranosyltransferase